LGINSSTKKSKKAAELLDQTDLEILKSKDTRKKQEELDLLKVRVKHFEQQVARDELKSKW